MKKYFEEPAIECVRLYSEAVTAEGGTPDGDMGTASGDVVLPD